MGPLTAQMQPRSQSRTSIFRLMLLVMHDLRFHRALEKRTEMQSQSTTSEGARCRRFPTLS
jgi:hypothetical protein